MKLIAYTTCYFLFDLANFIIWGTSKTHWLWVFPICNWMMNTSRNLASDYELDTVMWGIANQ